MKRSNLFWGLLLLVVGMLLLMDNLGLFAFLPLSIWQLIWPLAVIALGIWILWGSRFVESDFETETLNLPLQGAERADVTLEFGAGELILRGAASSGILAEGTFDGVEHQLSYEGNRARLRIKTPIINRVGFPWGLGPSYKRVWSFSLSDAVPLDVTLKTGASDNKLDMRTLQVKKLRLESGASSTRITLPANAGYTEVTGSSGAASVELHIPEGVAARIRASGGLSSINVDQRRFPKVGGAYTSPGYEHAENKVDIKMDIGVGSLTIS